MKLRPCDCKDIATAKMLNEQGIGHNDDSITVEPNVVVLKMGITQIRIPMSRFKMFAEWYLEEQEIENKNKMEETKKQINLETINGNEIIDFLNTFNGDISMSTDSFVFEKQEILEDTYHGNFGYKYKLTFTANFNNWGTEQPIKDNHLVIFSDGSIRFYLEEPFDSDDTCEILEEALAEWLETHTFDSTVEDKFRIILEDVYEKLPGISFESKEEMQQIIDALIKAKTYMK